MHSGIQVHEHFEERYANVNTVCVCVCVWLLATFDDVT